MTAPQGDLVVSPASRGRPEDGCVVTIGQFDGVHRGHQALVARARQEAAALGAVTAVVTFDRHPASVVRPTSVPKLLTDLDQKLSLLAAAGADMTLVLRFDEERAAEPAEDFVREVLVDRLRARAVVVGHDFHFGKGRQGNAALLRRMGAEHGFAVHEVASVGGPDGTVSSTAVRAAVASGRMEEAERLLGRPHAVRGRVVMGDGRGRELGFPTANIDVPAEIALPGDGVYAGECTLVDGTVRPTAVSVGTRPHFYEDGIRLVEAFLLDFEGDLYGQQAEVRFIARVRGQERFDGLEALVQRIHADVEEVRDLVERHRSAKKRAVGAAGPGPSC